MLNNIVSSFPCPTLGLGDFNAILNQSEKFDGKIFASSSQPNGLSHFMNQKGMADLGFSGPKYTCSNKRYGKNHIKERLDRGVANSH